MLSLCVSEDISQLSVPIRITEPTTGHFFATTALLDSGCMGTCVSSSFVEKMDIPTRPTAIPIPVYNADGSLNSKGSIRSFATLRVAVGDHQELLDMAVVHLDSADVFLGHDWLKRHNPSIDWITNTILFDRCPESCGYVVPLMDPDQEDDEENFKAGDRILMMDFSKYKEGFWLRQVWQDLKEEPNFTAEFSDVFSAQQYDQLPEHRPWDHAINLTEGFKASDCKIYPLSPSEQQSLQDFLGENLSNGRIHPSKSPMASPFFFIKKKDGTLRPIQDYRCLNTGTIKNKYPLPLIQELLDKTKNSKFFTKLDVRWGYYNIRIKEGDEWKAAFRTNRGLFEPTVMFFGLTNAPATFQTFMNEIFRDLIDDGHVVVYLDDVLIFANTQEHHNALVRQVLDIFRQHRLFLKKEKCQFSMPYLEYLGHIIGQGQLKMDGQKVAAVRDWPIPRNLRQLQSFLGFCNYYRRFIRDFSKIAKPLHHLTGKVPWSWASAQQTAFDSLKSAICQEPVLAIPLPDAPFRVEADASDFALGAVLSQQVDSKWHPVAFRSQSLTATERNYEIYDKELFAIIEALCEWRQYLLGSALPVEIFTDHQNLTFFRAPQQLNHRQARWFTELQEFNFTLTHKPGSQMGKADHLSRRADLAEGVTQDNHDVTLLKAEWFTRSMTIASLDDNLVQRIRQSSKNQDRVVAQALDRKDDDWSEQDGLVLFKERLYVPRNRKLREDIIRLHHNLIVTGHPGQKGTRELILWNYFWPQVTGDDNRYVAGCDKCQRTKPRRQLLQAPLRPHEAPPHPWHTISVDLIGELPKSRGYNAICVIVDRFSKQIHAIPTSTTCNALGMAQIFRDHIF
jgi:hypothetical protein